MEKEEFLEKQNEVKEGENPVDTQTTTSPEVANIEEDEEITLPNETMDASESEVEAPEQETNPINPIEQPEPRMFTQDEVNKLVGNARNEGRQSALNELVKTYGMEKIEDLGDIVGKSQQFDYINDEYGKAQDELGIYRTKEILSNAKINPSKFDDVKFYMKGKGVDITPQSILEEMGTHPEWVNSVSKTPSSTASNPVASKVEEVKQELARPTKQSFITSSANESTGGTNEAMPNEEDELAEVREWFNARK